MKHVFSIAALTFVLSAGSALAQTTPPADGATATTSVKHCGNGSMANNAGNQTVAANGVAPGSGTTTLDAGSQSVGSSAAGSSATGMLTNNPAITPQHGTTGGLPGACN